MSSPLVRPRFWPTRPGSRGAARRPPGASATCSTRPPPRPRSSTFTTNPKLHSVRDPADTGRMATGTARWSCTPYTTAATERLRAELGVSRELATILVRRGYERPEVARRHLVAEDRHDPFAFSGMDAACDLVLDHVRRGSAIVVHGDYDVDGVCSTAILIHALRRQGADPGWHIPSRDDGYGLSIATVERLAAQGTRLIVTADCAIGSVAEVARARDLGIDVLVTDHHRPGETLPDCAVLHPVVCGYPFEYLCAAGVAQKVSEALLNATGEDPAAAA